MKLEYEIAAYSYETAKEQEQHKAQLLQDGWRVQGLRQLDGESTMVKYKRGEGAIALMARTAADFE